MQSSPDFALLVGIPFVVILIAGMLRLDERIVAPRSRSRQRAARPRFSQVERGGEVLLADPDGRVADEETFS